MPSVKTPEHCCKNPLIVKRIYDLGSEGERTWLLCKFHCKQKIFNMHIKSQETIDEENQEVQQ